MKKNRIDIVTLGCSKNLVDSERLMAQFAAYGYEVVHDSENPKGEVVILNTCGFIGDAKEESVEAILKFAQAKEQGYIKKLYVMGCLSERYKSELETEIPEVDRYYGKFDWTHILNDMGHTWSNSHTQERIITTPNHYAYIKIAEGCNRRCAYCAIPIITGKYKSIPIEDIVNEVTMLRARGVKEFQLIAQDLTYYGKDIYKEFKIADLVSRISDIEGVEWIRLHYAYPALFPKDLLSVIANRANVCNYLDLALQHISDNQLSMMRRNITRSETYELISTIREEVPGIHLRTTLITGHPGETEEDFEQLKEFVRWARFERLGVFPYSEEEGTYSALHYEDSIAQEVKIARANEIMAIQEEISAQIQAQKIGTTLQVVIDRKEGEYYIGRTEYDSPEVDPEVLILSDQPDLVGSLVQVKITQSETYDLYGEIVDQ